VGSQRQRIDWSELSLVLVLVSVGLSIPGVFVVAYIEHREAREGWEHVEGGMWRRAVDGGWLYSAEPRRGSTFVPSEAEAIHGR